MQGSFRTIELSNPQYETAGLRWLTVKTPHLKGRGDICLWIPEVADDKTNLPIYILLHGVYGSAWVWAMKGGAHVTAQELVSSKQIKPAIVAMPSDGLWQDGSAYSQHNGYNFAKWITEDVPTAIRENIPQAGNASKLCIGGLSMGGYGALMLGCKQPTLFAAVSGHSSITQLKEMSLFVEDDLKGYREAGTTENVSEVVNKVGKIPPLRFDCGVDDPLIEGNRELHNYLVEQDIDHIYEEYAGGHEWPYWQEHVAKTLRFFDQYC